MRILSWLIGLALAIVIVVFALSNRQIVTVSLWPLAEVIQLPVYLSILVPLLMGILLGVFGGSAVYWRQKAHTRKAVKRLATLEHEVELLRSAGNTPVQPLEKRQPVEM